MNRGINLSAALKNASENVFGVEAEVDIGTQGHIGANTCVIPSLFAGIAEVARCRMACGREGIIALELAECVSEDIRRAFLFCRAQREGAAGTKTDSANDAVGVCNLSFDAAVRFELVAFNADDLELSLRFDEEHVIQGVPPAEFSAHTIECLPERTADFLPRLIAEVIIAAETTDFRGEVGIAAAVGQNRIVEVQGVAIIAAAAGNTGEIGIGMGVVKRNAHDFAAVGCGYFLVIAHLDHVFVHVESVVAANVGVAIASPKTAGASLFITSFVPALVEAIQIRSQ